MEIRYVALFITLCLQLPQSHASKQTFKHPHESDPSIYGDEIDLVQRSFNKKELNDDALIFYLRLVKQIFKKQRFKVNPQSEEHFVGTIALKLTKTQYELLANADIGSALNLNEIDGLVEEVFKQSASEEPTVATQILLEHYRQELIDSITSYGSPLVWCIWVLVVIYLTSRFYRLSKVTYSAVILFSIFTICAISYGMMYHDCLNDLEVEQMIQLSKEQSANNPCKDYHREHETFLGSFRATVMGSAENECHKHMRRTFKPSKKYCDPLDVFAKWSAKIQMSYFGSIFGELLELLSSVTSSSNILTRIISWTASIVFFAFVFITLIKVVVKHSFRGFFGLLSTTATPSLSAAAKDDEKTAFEKLHSKMDALLHENEHMKRELSEIREYSVERSIRDVDSLPRQPPVKKPKLESIRERQTLANDDDD